MRIRKFNESTNELEVEYSEDNMVKCMMIMNLINRPLNDNMIALADVIKDNLNKEMYDMLYNKQPHNTFIDFITSLIDKDALIKMFDKVVVQEGADYEDEWVATLRIDNRVVLLLSSPERGNSVRVEGNDYLDINILANIIKELCLIYNERLN